MVEYPEYADLKNLEQCVKRLTDGIPKNVLIVDIGKDFDETKNQIPIYQGQFRWKSFSVTLEKYVVVKSRGISEDVQFIGNASDTDGGKAFVADQTAQESKVGKPEPVDLEVLHAYGLEENDYEVNVWARAYDRWFSILKLMVEAVEKDLGATAQKVIQGTTGLFPYAPNTATALQQVLTKVIDSLTSGHEVGSLSTVIKVEPRPWMCQNASTNDWVGYRLILFANEDENDPSKHTQAYLTLWKFRLSQHAKMKGSTGVAKPPPNPPGDKTPAKPPPKAPEKPPKKR